MAETISLVTVVTTLASGLVSAAITSRISTRTADVRAWNKDIRDLYAEVHEILKDYRYGWGPLDRFDTHTEVNSKLQSLLDVVIKLNRLEVSLSVIAGPRARDAMNEFVRAFGDMVAHAEVVWPHKDHEEAILPAFYTRRWKNEIVVIEELYPQRLAGNYDHPAVQQQLVDNGLIAKHNQMLAAADVFANAVRATLRVPDRRRLNLSQVFRLQPVNTLIIVFVVAFLLGYTLHR